MAQSQHRPEDPADGAGLPDEPLAAASPAEELAVAEAVDATAFGLGGATGFESVVVALPGPIVAPVDGGDS